MNLPILRSAAGAVPFGLLLGCSQVPASAPALSAASVLIASSPADGSTVSGPVEELRFRFSRPVALAEVTVNGPEGMMPIMISPAGEVEQYSVPLAGLESGNYNVVWRVNSRGQPSEGKISFRVR